VEITKGAGNATDSVSGAQEIASSKPTKTQQSWRDVLPVHPAADLFPMMSETELRGLGEDIKKNGLKSPVIVWRSDELVDSRYRFYLLDGRNRLDAMELVGLKTFGSDGHLKSARKKDGDFYRSCYQSNPVSGATDPYAYVLSANIHRRHLTAEQRRELIAKLLKAKPGQSNRQIAKQVKADDKTVSKVRRELESTAEIPQLEKTTGADGKQRKQPKKRDLEKERRAREQRKREARGDLPSLKEILGADVDVVAEYVQRAGGVDKLTDCNGDTNQDRWQLSLSNMAGEAVSLPAYWKKEFGDWRAFEVSSDLLELARQAVDTWKEIADHLASLKAGAVQLAGGDADLTIPEFLRRGAA
jgi:hypothetical protein